MIVAGYTVPAEVEAGQVWVAGNQRAVEFGVAAIFQHGTMVKLLRARGGPVYMTTKRFKRWVRKNKACPTYRYKFAAFMTQGQKADMSALTTEARTERQMLLLDEVLEHYAPALQALADR